MPHTEAEPACPCSDCRTLRFQCWRVAVEQGATVEWHEHRWVIVPPEDFFEGWDERRAA